MSSISCPNCGTDCQVDQPATAEPVLCEVCFETVRPGKRPVRPVRSPSPVGTAVKSSPGERKAKKRKAAQSAAQLQKRKVIFGISIAGGCMLLLMVVCGFWMYWVATSIKTRMKQLASDDPQRVETALAALEAAGTDALPQIVQGIKGDSDQVREHCLTLLKKLGPNAESALGEFEDGLREGGKPERVACITAIGYLGDKGRSAQTEILKILQDGDAEIRAAAYETLAAVSTPKKIVGRLTEIVKDDKGTLRREAVVQLGKFGSDAKAAVSVLLTLCDEPAGKDGGELKEIVCRSLGQIRQRDEAVYKKLSSILGSGDEPLKLREAAAMALGTIGGEQAVESLSKVLMAAQAAPVMRLAAAGLGAVGPEAKAGKALDILNGAKTRAEGFEKTALEEARRREYSKRATPPKYKNVIVTTSRRRRGGETRKEWYTFRPTRRPSGLDRNARFYCVKVGGGGGPSEAALKATQKTISEKWATTRQAIDSAIRRIQG